MKNAVATRTIVAPDVRLYLKLKYKPITELNAPSDDATTIIVDSLCVIKYAVAAGVISIATTSTTPTVLSETTVTNVSNNIKK